MVSRKQVCRQIKGNYQKKKKKKANESEGENREQRKKVIERIEI